MGIFLLILLLIEIEFEILENTFFKSLYQIGLIRKMPTLKPVHPALWNFIHFVAFTKLRNAENLNLIS